MKGSLIILSFFIAGVCTGYFNLIPLPETDWSIYILYGLIFSVGIAIGYDKKILQTIRSKRLKILLLPLATLTGTMAGTALISVCLPKWSVTECMAVGAGFGYYSLSSIIITQYKGVELGTIALVSNIMRELFTLLAAPLLVVYFGKLSPISSGGATTADTTLPIITKYSGQEFVLIAIFHGIALDLCVPFLVTFLSQF